MTKHVVQTTEWAQFKNSYGTPAVTVGDVIYTKHQLPLTNMYYAYCPKVNPATIDFEQVKVSLEKNDCININFDVPNVLKGSKEEEEALKQFHKFGCVLAPRDQFASSNIILDLTQDEESLFANMHHKHRYNVKYAQKKGVETRIGKTQEDFDVFYELFKSTSIRQKYFVRSKVYYQRIWEMFGTNNGCHILTTYYDKTPLASWMLLSYENVLYYPYGGSSEEFKNLQGSTIIGWEAILLGKKLGCHTFDMWGASEDVENKKDPWWGFTNFKMRFGGKYVRYMDSYDLVLNHSVYSMFNVANNLRWKLLKAIK